MIEKLREELIEDIINYLDKSFSSRKFLPKVQNDIMQIIVDTFDDYELKVTGSNRFNKAENSMTQEAKFELLNYSTIENDITQIIVDSFDELEWSMNTNGNVELKNK